MKHLGVGGDGPFSVVRIQNNRGRGGVAYLAQEFQLLSKRIHGAESPS